MSEHSDFQELRDGDVSVALTASELDVASIVSSVKSPKAGAVVLFAGTRLAMQFSPHSLTLLL